MVDSLGEVPPLFDLLWYLPITDGINRLEKLGERLILARASSNEGSSNDLASHLVCLQPLSDGHLPC